MYSILQLVISERVWLPGKAEWKQVQHGEAWYIQAVPWLALVLLLIRSLACFVAGIVGVSIGIPHNVCVQPQRSAVLETAFRENKRPSIRDEEALAERLGWPAHHVRRWMHRARNWRKPSTLTKFKECSWRFLFYALSTAYGVNVLLNEPYFLDLANCYAGYPAKAPSSSTMSYWCLQLALYTSEVVACLTGAVPRKKDFTVLMTHHIVTIALLIICYAINMVPIGLVIAVLHDLADVFLEMAKLLVYIRYSTMANVMFAIFSLIFAVTRLVVLPNWVLPSLLYDLPQHAGHHSYITGAAIALILALMCLHIYWFSLIVRVAVRLVASPVSQQDSRSDSELSDSDTV